MRLAKKLEEVRRNLQQKFGWPEARIAQAIDTIAAFTNHVTPVEAIDAVPTDPDDNQVLECALAAGSEVIVSVRSVVLPAGTYPPSRCALRRGKLHEDVRLAAGSSRRMASAGLRRVAPIFLCPPRRAVPRTACVSARGRTKENR